MYEDDTTKFIVQIKLLYSNTFYNKRTKRKHNSYKIFGSYYLSKHGVVIENNLDNLKNFAPYDKYDDINWEKVWDNKGYTPPIWGFVASFDIAGQIRFRDRTTKRTPYGDRAVALRVNSFDAFNNRLYWDLNDIIIYELFECAISDAVYAEWEKQQKGKVFAVPEKCTLTRISHDPYYEIDIDL